MEILKNPNYDFLGKAKYFIPVSLAVIAAGLFMIGTRAACATGVEFSGGTQVIAKFKDDAPGRPDPRPRWRRSPRAP